MLSWWHWVIVCIVAFFLEYFFSGCTTTYELSENCVSKENVAKMPVVFQGIYDKPYCWLVDTLPNKEGMYKIKCKNKSFLDWLLNK